MGSSSHLILNIMDFHIHRKIVISVSMHLIDTDLKTELLQHGNSVFYRQCLLSCGQTFL
jgi:hypothetical protein